jgi:hypothetical protein
MLLVQLCQAQHWYYLLRIDKAHTCRRGPRGRWMDWAPCNVVVHTSGQQWAGTRATLAGADAGDKSERSVGRGTPGSVVLDL